MPLHQTSRYKAAYGGRSGGKSHYFAEAIVQRMVADPDLRVVCIREIQKSLRFSAKALIEKKVREFNVSHLFDVLTTEIRRKGGNGICIFQGMQDHTADSLKSLEGFGVAWVEEAQNLSNRSLTLLRPTIRAAGSEIWFSWNPEQPTDAVDRFFRSEEGAPSGAIVVSVNYDQNPLLPTESLAEMALDRKRDTDYYNHVWKGGYNVKSQLQILGGKWRIDEFVPGAGWDGPYYGADWGFAADPTAAVKLWLYDRCLWVEYESWALELELDQTAQRWIQDIPDIERHTVRADNSRPESISHVKRAERDRPGISGLIAADKWAGSVKDGIAYLRNFEAIVVHERCQHFIEECRLYRYKTNAAGDILPEPVDKDNHCLAPDTLVETINGAVRIDQVKPGMMVLTRKGYRRVLDAWISDRNVKTYEVKTSNGLALIGTGNHKVFTNKGFTSIDALSYNDRVVTLNPYSWQQLKPSKLSMGVLSGLVILKRNGELREFTSNQLRRNVRAVSGGCTDVSGQMLMGKYQRTGTCIMLMRTLLTMPLIILNAFLEPFTSLSIPSAITEKTGKRFYSAWRQFDRLRWLGIANPRRGKPCTKNWARTLAKRIVRPWNALVITVAKAMRSTTSLQAALSFAPTPANQHGEEKLGWTMLNVPAQLVSNPLLQTNTATPDAVVASVLNVLEAGVLPEVWDLTVDGEHEFFANGILVHNCIDGTRYALAPLIKKRMGREPAPVPQATANSAKSLRQTF